MWNIIINKNIITITILIKNIFIISLINEILVIFVSQSDQMMIVIAI